MKFMDNIETSQTSIANQNVYALVKSPNAINVIKVCSGQF